MSKTAARKKVKFVFKSAPGNDVFVAGTFSDWLPGGNRLKDKDGDGIYQASILIPKGRHEYKFVVDDEWVIDPENPEWTANGHGSLNSVITVE